MPRSRKQMGAIMEAMKGPANRYGQLAAPPPAAALPPVVPVTVPAIPKIKMPTRHPAQNLGRFLHKKRGM